MITKNEIKWLTGAFPNLSIDEKKGVIEGKLIFCSVYDKNKKESGFTAFPKSDVEYPGLMLSGEYHIRIQQHEHERKIPKLWVYIAQEKMSAKRHFFNKEGGACMAGPTEEDDLFTRGYSFAEYLERYVIPFLYAQTYYDTVKSNWPWEAYSHNAAGIFQSFHHSEGTKSQVLACLKQLKVSSKWSEIQQIMKGSFDGKDCLCGSKDKLNQCHPNLVLIAQKFKKALNDHSIPL